MKLIQSQYPAYCRNQDEKLFTLGVMEKIFIDWEYQPIENALVRFMQNDSKGFAPVPGQLITLATEMRRAAWDKRQRELDALPEPKSEPIPMPDDIREKLEGLFKL